MGSLLKEKYLDKEYEKMSWKELVNAPLSAISGISKQDGEELKKAFGINSIKDLALNEFVILASGINAFSKASGKIFNSTFNSTEYEELRKKPIKVISGISDKDASTLKHCLNINNIQELAENIYVSIAQTITTLGLLEEQAESLQR